jgi:hypothetical protein
MKIENVEIINEAIAEAQRFIKKAELAKERIIEETKTKYSIASSKETGALKRSAIDLGRMCTIINKLKSY